MYSATSARLPVMAVDHLRPEDPPHDLQRRPRQHREPLGIVRIIHAIGGVQPLAAYSSGQSAIRNRTPRSSAAWMCVRQALPPATLDMVQRTGRTWNSELTP